MKKTVVLGASPNPERYSYRAVELLVQYGYEVIPIGKQKGKIAGITIIQNTSFIIGVHTVTLYLNSINQVDFYNYIIKLKPKRVIFNPGTENSELIDLCRKNNIEPFFECTLVMLSLV